MTMLVRRRILGSMLFVFCCLMVFPAVAQDSSNFVLRYFVDEFGDPTRDSYLLGKAEGVFSNSATTNSKLNVSIILSQYEFGIVLYEYGDYKVKSENTYTVSIKTSDGTVHQVYSAKLYPKVERISLNYLPWGLDPSRIFDGESVTKFSIVEEGRPQTRYIFSCVFPSIDYLQQNLGDDIRWLYTFK